MSYGNYAPFYRTGYFNPMQPMMPMDTAQYAQQAQQMPQMQAQSASDMIWVQGEAGAKAYLVAPNATVTLWDSENPTIYVKSADPSGHPTMRVLDFVERTSTPAPQNVNHSCQCNGKYEEMKSEIIALREEVAALKTDFEKNIVKVKKQKEEADNA